MIHALRRDPTALSNLLSSMGSIAATPSQRESLFGACMHNSLSMIRSISSTATTMAEMRFPYKIKKRTPGSIDPPVEGTPELAPLEPIAPFNVTQQSRLALHGGPRQLTGDPGSIRWTAPYYIPLELQKVRSERPMLREYTYMAHGAAVMRSSLPCLMWVHDDVSHGRPGIASRICLPLGRGSPGSSSPTPGPTRGRPSSAETTRRSWCVD